MEQSSGTSGSKKKNKKKPIKQSEGAKTAAGAVQSRSTEKVPVQESSCRPGAGKVLPFSSAGQSAAQSPDSVVDSVIASPEQDVMAMSPAEAVGGSDNSQADGQAESLLPARSTSSVVVESSASEVEQSLPSTFSLDSNTETLKSADATNSDTKSNVTQESSLPPSDSTADGPTKSKAQLRAERRAIQEAQRAAKQAGRQAGGSQKESAMKAPPKPVEAVPVSSVQKGTGAKGPLSNVPVKKAESTQVKKPDQPAASSSGPKDMKVRVPDSAKVDDSKVMRKQSKKLEKQCVPQRPSGNQKKVSLFRHLIQYERSVRLTHKLEFNSPAIHPAIIRLGLKYSEGIITGSNARCIALLTALKQVITDYTTPQNTDLARDLEMHIRPYLSFLNQCRPMSVSMGNAVKYLKHHITHTSRDLTDEQAKEKLLESIDEFIERIKLAMQAISNEAVLKIQDGDTILVYSCSSLVIKVLADAHRSGTKFHVVVVDARPQLDGQKMLNKLVNCGISCTYILINALSYVMNEVTKVFLGASALLANGYVMSRVGSSQVALVARAFNIPVLVCCETYKFCERVQTDSFVFNELGDPHDVMTVRGAVNKDMVEAWQNNAQFNVLNLVYDVTPSEMITMVITELGMIPCTSVPVVLRVKCADN